MEHYSGDTVCLISYFFIALFGRLLTIIGYTHTMMYVYLGADAEWVNLVSTLDYEKYFRIRLVNVKHKHLEKALLTSFKLLANK